MANKEHLIHHLLMARNIRGYVKRLQEPEGHGDYWKGYNSALNDILSFIDSMQEEPVSDNLDDAAFDYAESCKYDGVEKLLCVEHFKAGAKWQKDKQ